jgi:hypothetical protein
MKQLVVCSECGLTSGRKGNVLRHISSQHSGQGAVLGLMQYLLKSLQGELPIPTYHRPAGQFDVGHSSGAPKQPADILLDHARMDTQKTLKLVSGLALDSQVVILGIDVCEKCFAYRYLWNGNSPTVPDKTDHQCDLEWVFNNPQYFEKKEIAVDLLKKRAIAQLASFLNTVCEGRPRLMAIPPPNARQRKLENETAKVVASRFARDYTPLEMIFHKALTSSKPSQDRNQPQLSQNQFELLNRARSGGPIALTEEELTEFLAINQTTFPQIRIGDELYHFYVPVKS